MKQPESLGQSLSSSWRLRDDLCCSASLTSSPAEGEGEKKPHAVKLDFILSQNKTLSMAQSPKVRLWSTLSVCLRGESAAAAQTETRGLLLFCIRCTKSSRVFPPEGFTASVYRKAVWALSDWVTGNHWRTSKPVTILWNHQAACQWKITFTIPAEIKFKKKPNWTETKKFFIIFAYILSSKNSNGKEYFGIALKTTAWLSATLWYYRRCSLDLLFVRLSQNSAL